MRTYYIEIERQGWTLAIVKVEAETYEEAEYKALKALHMNDDISEASEESVKARLDSGDIDYVIDENGNEIDTEDKETDDKYMLYMQDESGFETTYSIDNEEEAIAEAIRIWENGEGGYSRVAVHQLRKEQDVDDISKDNRIWYAEH